MSDEKDLQTMDNADENKEEVKADATEENADKAYAPRFDPKTKAFTAVVEPTGDDVTDEDLNETDIEQNEDEPTDEDLSEVDPDADKKPGGKDDAPEEEPEAHSVFEEIPESKAPHFGVKDFTIMSDGLSFKIMDADEERMCNIDLDVITLLRIALNKVRKTGNVDAINKINDALSGICSALK